MENKEAIYNGRKVSKSKAWLHIFIFRVVLWMLFDKTGKQILFYCTAGGGGIMGFIFIFYT